MKWSFSGMTVADHPDKERLARSDAGGLCFLRLPAVRCQMLLVGGWMKWSFSGMTVADHLDKERSARSDAGRLQFLLVPAVECRMLLCGGWCHAG